MRSPTDSSRNVCSSTLALAPADGEVLNGLVRAHTLLEENDAALSWGEKVIEVTSSDRAWWTKALKRPGMSPREEAACRRSIDHLDRLEASVHLNSYSILAATEDLNSALEHLESTEEQLEQFGGHVASTAGHVASKACLAETSRCIIRSRPASGIGPGSWPSGRLF